MTLRLCVPRPRRDLEPAAAFANNAISPDPGRARPAGLMKNENVVVTDWVAVAMD